MHRFFTPWKTVLLPEPSRRTIHDQYCCGYPARSCTRLSLWIACPGLGTSPTGRFQSPAMWDLVGTRRNSAFFLWSFSSDWAGYQRRTEVGWTGGFLFRSNIHSLFRDFSFRQLN